MYLSIAGFLNQQVLTEQELIKGCIRNDSTSQRMLFELFAGGMMTICLRYARNRQEAEDILQEAFIRAFKYIHQFRHKGSLEGWMKCIAVNCALRLLQRNPFHFEEIREENSTKAFVDPEVLSNLNEEDLLKLISQLPDGYRMVFNLFVMEGYNHDEIAQLLRIKPATSRSQLSKARKLLQENINNIQLIRK